MKKILFTTNHPAPYIDKQVDILRRNFSVDIVYKKRKDNYKKWKGFSGFKGKYYDEMSLLDFINYYRKHDIAILGGWSNLYCFLTILCSFLFKTRCCVFSDHPTLVIKKNIWFYVRKYILFNSLDFILCATESTRYFYNRNYGISYSKLLLFPYCYDDSYSNDNKDINSKRQFALKNDNEKINVFIANNFIKRKGYSSILTAFELLHEKNKLSKYRIRIAGNGELHDEIKNRLDKLNEDITLLGWIEDEQYLYEMDHCDVFIHASVFEPFGIPPLDAMCRGKMLIASDGVESVNTIIENGVNGFVFEADNGRELANVLENISRSQIYAIGYNGRNKLLETYNNRVFETTIKKVIAGL